MALTSPDLPRPTAGEDTPYCVIAKHRATPGQGSALVARMLKDLQATRSEASCLQFHIHRDRTDPDLIVIYEVWRSIDALKSHFGKAYVQSFVVDAGELEPGDMETQWLEMLSPYASGRDPG
ncbi:antibiotic biosynthesis monooxygenase [Mesorhizobium sp. M1423]|uniref:putative quinol monooxygenase n=1 Tax=Mesorhizobium sp. M1423 TaxID=2957101 RepID=UPI003338B443